MKFTHSPFKASDTMVRKLADRKGSVSLIFATALIPLLMMVGLAVDYGFYNEAQAQLNMAADAAAIHAARVAAQLSQAGDPLFAQKGEADGRQWFLAQLGNVPQALTNNFSPTVVVKPSDGNKQVTAQVNYAGVIIAHFGNLFPGNWPQYPNWGIAGSATAVISIPSYVEVLMLLDNSSSMLIAQDDANIQMMEALTPCSTQAANEGQTIDGDYSWAYVAQPDGTWLWNPIPGNTSPSPYPSVYSTVPAYSTANPAPKGVPANLTIPYGYGTFYYPGINGVLEAKDIVPPASSQVGNCDGRFTGGSGCVYPGSIPGLSQVSATSGQCLNGGGGPGSLLGYKNTPLPATSPLSHMPQAPCAFACHSDPGNNDYYGLAKANNVKLRYDALQAAAADVIGTMETSTSNNQLSVGVYQFNAPLTANAQPDGVNQVYPAASGANVTFSGAEAGPAVAEAETLTKQVLPPSTGDNPDTNFENAMSLLKTHVAASGSGATAKAPQKNLFIVTDGMDDYYQNPASQTGRVQGPLNPLACQQWTTPVGQFTPDTLPAPYAHQPGLGFTVYVLYTKYFPLPNPYYLANDKAAVETVTASGLTSIEQAMQSCASSPADFYEATNSGDIQNSLQAMLAAALGSAGRLSN